MDVNIPQSAHLVGVCGAGMRAMAELLFDLKWTVTGSDISAPNPATQALITRGLRFIQGHFESNLNPSTKLLIYSPAIPVSNVERISANRHRIPEVSYGQMVAQFMESGNGVCIAGTHGKSTTTAMVSQILQASGRLSGAVLGAELCETGRSGWKSPGDLFVAESCEYQQTFHHFQPRFSTILGIEPDHFDCYPDLESLVNAFCEFADRTNPNGVLLLNHDCPHSAALRTKTSTRARKSSFGLHDGADWQASQINSTSTGIDFQLSYQEANLGSISLRLHGRHNVMNGLAAAALCGEIGIPVGLISQSLSRFQGIRRRLELLGEPGRILFFDDYAHHPTAVKITLETLRHRFGNRTIRCVFQPHQVLRTKMLMKEFAASFGAADEVLVAPVFAARESALEQSFLASEELANQIVRQGIVAKSYGTLDQIVSTLEYSSRPGDVIVTMGAGDIDRIYHEFTRRIPTDSAAG